MDENDISHLIRGAIFTKYNAFGPGLLESAYENVLSYVLREQGLDVKQQLQLPYFLMMWNSMWVTELTY